MTVDVGYLELENGKSPYLDWEQKLSKDSRGMVRMRINRLRLGNFGDCKIIKGISGLCELRIHFGPGYRLYFGKAKEKLIIVLCGGDKRSQARDIEKAKEYWRYYRESLKKR